MSHIDLKHVLNIRVYSESSSFLDAAEAHIDAVASEVYEEREYHITQGVEEERAEDGKVAQYVDVRVPYLSSEAQAALDAFDWVAGQMAEHSSQVADGSYMRLYKSPTGGVTAQQVQAWYEEHPEEQPTDSEGEGYIPSSWQPENHIIEEL